MTSVTHIVPRFPPQIDGLGDYCHLLAEQLFQSRRIPYQIVVGDPAWTGSAQASAVSAVVRRERQMLVDKIESSRTVVLHYVCYGYHSRGVPFWINQALKQWKFRAPENRLVVVFHELWASGPPWKSEFYLSAIQRHLVRELHRLCDAAMTSVPVMFQTLEKIVPGKTVFQPIPSNLPLFPGPNERQTDQPLKVIAFGQVASRQKALKTHSALLVELYKQGLLEELRIVGKGATGGNAPSQDVAFARTLLPESIIRIEKDVAPERGSELIAGSDLFLSYYPSKFLCKSGALMAALANGCIPILPETDHAEPLSDGGELLACNGSPAAVTRIVGLAKGPSLRAIASRGQAWYKNNADWPVVVRNALPLLGPEYLLS